MPIDISNECGAAGATEIVRPLPHGLKEAKLDPDVLLNREDTARALSEHGFPTAASTLATKATRGGGPPYRLFGRKPLYKWGDALKWAQSRLSEPASSSSEHGARARERCLLQAAQGPTPQTRVRALGPLSALGGSSFRAIRSRRSSKKALSDGSPKGPDPPANMKCRANRRIAYTLQPKPRS
jgi:hypothetical protein